MAYAGRETIPRFAPVHPSRPMRRLAAGIGG